MSRVRVAVALVLSHAQEERIDAVRGVLGSRALDRIVPHVTLLPPHERDPAGVNALLRQVAEVVAQRLPPPLEFSGIGVFANRRATAHLAVSDADGWIGELAAELGWPGDRPFVPHVTIREGGALESLEHLVRLGAEFRAPVEPRAVAVLLARMRDPRRRWRSVLEARLGESWVVVRSHLRLRIVVSDGAWVAATDSPTTKQRSAVALVDDEVIGVVSARRASDAAWVLDDARVFDPDLRGFGVGSALRDALGASLAPAALVAPAGTALLERRGAFAVGDPLARALGLAQDSSWIALSFAS